MSNELLNQDKVNKKAVFLKGTIIGIISAFAAMALFSALLLFLNLDRAYSVPFATISVAVGIFLASYYTAKKIGDKGYLIGIITSVTVFLFITVLSFALGKPSLNINTLFHLIIMLLSGTVGGIMGVNSDKKQRYI